MGLSELGTVVVGGSIGGAAFVLVKAILGVILQKFSRWRGLKRAKSG